VHSNALLLGLTPMREAANLEGSGDGVWSLKIEILSAKSCILAQYTAPWPQQLGAGWGSRWFYPPPPVPTPLLLSIASAIQWRRWAVEGKK